MNFSDDQSVSTEHAHIAEIAAVPQDEIDDCALLYAVNLGKPRALAILAALETACRENRHATGDAMASLWARIAAAVADEPGTIIRIATRHLPKPEHG